MRLFDSVIYPNRYKRGLYLKRYKTALLALALTGCATTRYVTTPCLTQSQLTEIQKAEPPKVGSKLTGHADEDVRTIAGSAIRLRGYADGLLTVLGGCSGN